MTMMTTDQEEARVKALMQITEVAHGYTAYNASTSVEFLVNLCHLTSKTNGFWDDDPDRRLDDSQGSQLELFNRFAVCESNASAANYDLAKLMLMVSELAEACEAIRTNSPADAPKIGEGWSHLAEELADCAIRMFDFAGRHKLNLGGAILAKMQYNLSRPYKHGKKA